MRTRETCRVCREGFPFYYVDASQICFECYLARTEIPRREIPRRESPMAPAAATVEQVRLQDPIAFAAAVSAMSRRQREAYLAHFVHGLGVAGVAARLRIQAPAASLLLKRIRALFDRAGLRMPGANSSRPPGAVPTVPAQVCFVPHRSGATNPQRVSR